MLDLVVKVKKDVVANRDFGNAAPQAKDTGYQYNVDILKKMLANQIENVKRDQNWAQNSISREFNDARIRDDIIRLGRSQATVRFLAALIENDGVLTDNFKSFDKGWVGLDSMSYSATAGADTSWWTKGT